MMIDSKEPLKKSSCLDKYVASIKSILINVLSLQSLSTHLLLMKTKLHLASYYKSLHSILKEYMHICLTINYFSYLLNCDYGSHKKYLPWGYTGLIMDSLSLTILIEQKCVTK